MDAALALANLKQFLQEDEDGIPWEPNGETLPNASWLTRVYEYPAAQHGLTREGNLESFKKLAIIPDQFGRLSRPGLMNTPLWPADEKASDSQFRKLLRVLRVPLIHGSARLLKSMRTAFDEACSKVVWSVTGPDLVDSISDTIDEWDQKARRYHPEIHDRLLDFLSEWKLSEYSDSQLDRLRQLPIFSTSAKALVTADDPSVLVPAEAQLPNPPGVSSSRSVSVGHGSHC